MNKVKTMDLKGNEYAKVADRLKAFWEKHPNASVKTHFQHTPDGGMVFTADIIADKTDEASREANGHAMYTAVEMKKPKAFEKLETIATGRALAKLGYLNDGEIATTEEMEEFRAYQDEQRGKEIEQAIFDLEKAKTMQELQKVYINIPNNIKPYILNTKDNMKAKLQEI